MVLDCLREGRRGGRERRRQSLASRRRSWKHGGIKSKRKRIPESWGLAGFIGKDVGRVRRAKKGRRGEEAHLDLGRLEGGDGANEGGSDASHCRRVDVFE
jgi:hypothetical protein